MATVNIGNVSDEFYRYKMPVMKTQILSRGNGIKTWVVNVSDIAKALSRPPDYLIKFFGFELGAQTKWEAAAQKGIVNGEHTLETLNGLLAQFISKFVTCAACKNPETNIFLRGDTVRLECVACGNTTKVDPIERLCSYIKNHPPAENAKKKTTSVDKVGATPAAEENVEAIASVDVNVLANQIDSLQVQQKEENPIEVLSAWGREHPDASADDVLAAVDRYMVIHDLKADDGVLLLFTSGLINAESLVRRIKVWGPVIAGITKEYGGPVEKKLFPSMATMMTTKEQLALIPNVLSELYDADAIDETATRKWFKKAKSKDAPKEHQKLRKAAKPFLDWLKSAEEEGSGDDN
nr:translation initiation factor 5 [Andalucia godoyi]|eukprot:ANDGO_00936.mRNA.1 putative eukaryotic translation initiation factor 5